MTIICLSGIAGGCFAFPLRTRKVYAEENTLLGAYLLATLIIPLVAATVLLPAWPRVFTGVPARQVLVPLLCGMGWGLAAFAYAQGVSRVGIGMTVSTVMGLTVAVGSAVPLASRWGEAAPALRGWILGGAGACVLGVALLGAAGRMRDGAGTGKERKGGGRFVAGFLWSAVSGLLTPLANIGFDAGAPFVARATQLGGDPRLSSAMLGWFPTWWGGILVLIVVLGIRMVRRGTWRLYGARGSRGDLLRTLAMGALHFLGQVPYGIGAILLGAFGTSIGWAATLGSQLLTANVLGAFMGEWQGSTRPSRLLAVVGLVVVMVAVALLARASLLA